MAMFTVTVVNGPNWDSSHPRREQPAWTEHAAFMDQLVDDAMDESDIKERFDQDPWIPMGVIQIATIAPWTIWLDGRRRVCTHRLC